MMSSSGSFIVLLIVSAQITIFDLAAASVDGSNQEQQHYTASSIIAA